jgi:hypothetical protein
MGEGGGYKIDPSISSFVRGVVVVIWQITQEGGGYLIDPSLRFMRGRGSDEVPDHEQGVFPPRHDN